MGLLMDSGHARHVMHAGIVNFGFSLKLVAGKTFPVHSQRMRNP